MQKQMKWNEIEKKEETKSKTNGDKILSIWPVQQQRQRFRICLVEKAMSKSEQNFGKTSTTQHSSIAHPFAALSEWNS